MPNHTPPVGYPYGPVAPFPHDDANDIIEDLLKTPNADEGSSHAPTNDLEWSGSAGGGFRFDTLAPFPFYGHLDVTSNLRFTAPVGGSVVFDELVAIDILGPLSLKAGFSASVNIEAGITVTFQSTAVCTVASGATMNLSGATDVRGTMTFKTTANGGPGIAVWEGTGTQLVGNSGAVGTWGGIWIFSNGLTVSAGTFLAQGAAILTGATSFTNTVLHTDKVTHSGADAYRVLRSDNGPDNTTTVNLWEADIWVANITNNRAWTLNAPPSNVPFVAFVGLGAATGGFSLTLTPVNGGPYVLNTGGPQHAAVVWYDGAMYHAVISKS